MIFKYFKIATLSLILTIVCACQPPAINTVISNNNINKVNSKTIISGIVEFPVSGNLSANTNSLNETNFISSKLETLKKELNNSTGKNSKSLDSLAKRLEKIENNFSIKSDIANVVPLATVSLIDPDNNVTLATGLTDAGGGFTINPGFVPGTSKVYILEAAKRLEGGGIGKTLASIRTYIRYNGSNWDSLTAPLLKINEITTAIAVIAGLRPSDVTISQFLGKINSTNGYYNEVSGINREDLNDVTELVNHVLLHNGDPIKYIALNNIDFSTFIIKNPDILKGPISQFAIGDVLLYKLGNILQIANSENESIDIVPGNNGNLRRDDYFLTADKTSVIYKTEKGIFRTGLNGNPNINLTGDLTSDLGNDFNFVFLSRIKNNLSKALFQLDDNSGQQPTKNGLYIIDINSGNINKISGSLTESSDSYFINVNDWSFSPDGNKLQFSYFNNSVRENYIADINHPDNPGNPFMISLPEGGEIPDDEGMYWSPDSNKLAYRNSIGFYAVNLNDGVSETLLSVSPSIKVSSDSTDNYQKEYFNLQFNGRYSPVFSSDSSKVVWYFDNNDTGRQEFHMADANATDNTTDTTFIQDSDNINNIYNSYISWAADAPKIAFAGIEQDTSKLKLYVHDFSDNSTSTIISNDDDEISSIENPKIASDGSKIFFSAKGSFTGNQWKLLKTNTSGVNQFPEDTGMSLGSDYVYWYDRYFDYGFMQYDNPNKEIAYFNNGNNILVMNSNGTGLKNIHSQFGNGMSVPSFVPNSSKIIAIEYNNSYLFYLYDTDNDAISNTVYVNGRWSTPVAY